MLKTFLLIKNFNISQDEQIQFGSRKNFLYFEVFFFCLFDFKKFFSPQTIANFVCFFILFFGLNLEK